MDVSERDKKKLKSGASNFEKQKNESKKPNCCFFCTKKTADREWMSISPLRGGVNSIRPVQDSEDEYKNMVSLMSSIWCVTIENPIFV